MAGAGLEDTSQSPGEMQNLKMDDQNPTEIELM